MAQVYMAAAETLAKLHTVVPEDVGLGNYGPRAGYCKRQVRHQPAAIGGATAQPSATAIL
jgi:hypothetical protein